MPANPNLGRPRQGDFKFSSAWATYCILGQFKNSFLFLKWKFIQNKIQSSSEDRILLKFANPANTTSVSPLLSQVSSVYFARAQTALASSSGLGHPTLHSFTYSGYPETCCTLCSKTVWGTTEQGWPKTDVFAQLVMGKIHSKGAQFRMIRIRLVEATRGISLTEQI